MRRPLIRFVLPFAAGVMFSLYLLPVSWQGGAAAALMLSGLLLAWLWKGKRAAVAVTCAGLCAGILWTAVYTEIFLAPCDTADDSERVMTLELVDYPQKTAQGMRCAVRAEGFVGRAVYYGELEGLVPGDRLHGTVRCRSAAAVTGGYANSFAAGGVFLLLYSAGEMEAEKGDSSSLRYLPQRLKQTVARTAERIYAEEVHGLILALLTGDKDALSEQSRSDLEESGLMHLTAVSGLHCGFLVAIVGFFFGTGSFLTLAVGYPILLLYMVAVGCTPSVVRACIMLLFALAAPLLRRENDLPTSICAAGGLILLADPYAFCSVSFQLSFAAVSGICLVTPRVFHGIYPAVKPRGRILRKLWIFTAASVSATLGALIFTMPISAYWFRTISLVAPLSNLLALLAVQILFATALIATLLCAVFPALAPLSAVPMVLGRYVLDVASVCASIPGHGVSFNGYLGAAWLVFVYVLLLVCVVSGAGRKRYAVAAVLAALTLFILREIPAKTVENDTLTIVAVDVGQGAAALLHSNGQTALIDCGSDYAARGSGAAVADAMDTYGWKSVQYVVLTHYHEDHAGGLAELLARVEVETLVIPPEGESELQSEVLRLAGQYDVEVRYIYMTNMIRLGEARLVVYPPLTRGEINEEGLTIVCSAGDFDAVFTGDMGASTERLLIETYDLCDAEVLFVGHHGSKYSTSEEFLKTITPEVGIISVGENSYGHPTTEAMERMAFYGMELYRTDWQGNILIRIK